MKDKQEQIEEMAPHMCFTCEMNTCFCECIQHGDELCGMAYEAADRLYSAGYRKASDVIDEFVERMKEENETSFRRYGKGIGMHDIFLISDKMKFEIFTETQKDGQAMKYERLTKRKGNVVMCKKPITSNYTGSIYEEQKELSKEVVFRLAELEDKIECGELCEREEVRKETAREIADWLRGWLEWDEEGVVREIKEKYDLEDEQ